MKNFVIRYRSLWAAIAFLVAGLLSLRFWGLLGATGTSNLLSLSSPFQGQRAPSAAEAGVEFWLTRANQSALLEMQPALMFRTDSSSAANNDIVVDDRVRFQSVDGFGFALTGGSAQVINAMESVERDKLLFKLFGNGVGAIGINYLRLSIGASDLNSSVFSYDDVPGDIELTHFSLAPDMAEGTGVIPLLRQILTINPQIKILASPWSAPAWMKDNNSTIAGSLLPKYQDAYARYFVKYIQQMRALGIRIDAITIQNEPDNNGNNPSMVMSDEQEAHFVKSNLGPAFRAAGLDTKVVVWDGTPWTNTRSQVPINILNDAQANPYISGSAFHMYESDGNSPENILNIMSQTHSAHPDKEIYFTERATYDRGNDFAGYLMWHTKNIIIGTMRNWSRVALEWNLASDPEFGPHIFNPTPQNGPPCVSCQGAVTVSGSEAIINAGFYIVGHASKFVKAGAVRISSEGFLPNVAFKNPDGRNVLIVLNESNQDQKFQIRYHGQSAPVVLPALSVGTFGWSDTLAPPQGLTPVLVRAGRGCDDGMCLWFIVKNIESDFRIDMRKVGSGETIDWIYQQDRVGAVLQPDGTYTVTLRLSEPEAQQALQREGLNCWIVNPTSRTWTDGNLVK